MYKVCLSFLLVFNSILVAKDVPTTKNICEVLLGTNQSVNPHLAALKELKRFRAGFSSAVSDNQAPVEAVAFGTKTSEGIISSKAEMQARLDAVMEVLSSDLSTVAQVVGGTSRGKRATVRIDNDPLTILSRVDEARVRAAEGETTQPLLEGKRVPFNLPYLMTGFLLGGGLSLAAPLLNESIPDILEQFRWWGMFGLYSTGGASLTGFLVDWWKHLKAVKDSLDDIPVHLQGDLRLQEISNYIRTQSVLMDHDVYFGLNYQDEQGQERHLDLHFFILKMRPYLIRIEW